MIRMVVFTFLVHNCSEVLEVLCVLVAGLALQSQGCEVKSVRINSAFHPSEVGT